MALSAELNENLLPFHYKIQVMLMGAYNHVSARKPYVEDFGVYLLYRVFLVPLVYDTFYTFSQIHTNRVRNVFSL